MYPTLDDINALQHKTEHVAFISYLRTGRIPLACKEAIELTATIKANFDPNQPRTPAGTSTGGQWADTGSIPVEPPLEPAYPIETLLLGLPSFARGVVTAFTRLSTREAIAAARIASGGAKPGSYNDKVRKAAETIEDYLGGKPDIISRHPKTGDMYIMKGNKKIRLNILDPHGYDPHFHIEEGYYSGQSIRMKWRDAGKHMYFFKKGK